MGNRLYTNHIRVVDFTSLDTHHTHVFIWSFVWFWQHFKVPLWRCWESMALCRSLLLLDTWFNFVFHIFRMVHLNCQYVSYGTENRAEKLSDKRDPEPISICSVKKAKPTWLIFEYTLYAYIALFLRLYNVHNVWTLFGKFVRCEPTSLVV